MKILHTSDWHFGKLLDGKSRFEEQEIFVEEISEIVNNEKIDLVIIAGDVYDKVNPNAKAEQLFYTAINKLCNNGKTVVLIIAGNHDNYERLTAARELAKNKSIILVGLPNEKLELFDGENYSITKSECGIFELVIRDEKCVIMTMPYPSEVRLGTIIKGDEEFDAQQNYSKYIGELIKEREDMYSDDSINLFVGHFFVAGSNISDSEVVSVGGLYQISGDNLPEKAQYIAMGHLHRKQKIKAKTEHAYYSGSPLQYSKSERKHTKCVMILDATPSEIVVKEYMLKNYKPIFVEKFETEDEALKYVEDNKNLNAWLYIEINQITISTEILKKIKLANDNIIEVKLVGVRNNTFEHIEYEEIEEDEEEFMLKNFIDFFEFRNNEKPNEAIIEIFNKIRLESE